MKSGSGSVKKAPPGEVIYTGVSLECVQLWDQAKRIRQTRELGLGNFVAFSPVFHVGNSKKDRDHWKLLYPELADEIDRVPLAKTLPEKGSPVVFQIPERVLMDLVRLCCENELYFEVPFQWAGATEADRRRVIASIKRAAGEYLLISNVVGETTSMMGAGLPAAVWLEQHGIDVCKADMQTMRDWFVARPHALLEEGRRAGVLDISTSVEATPQDRLAMTAGVRIPIHEGVPSDMAVGLAAARGTARAYSSPVWGACFAMGWHRAPVDDDLPKRVRIAYNLFYAGGCRIFYDLNHFFHVYSAPSGFFTEQSRPPFRRGEKEFRDFDDPVCVAGRKALSDHYRFVKFHRRPKGGPRVRMAVALGNLDPYVASEGQTHVWGVSEPGWEVGDAERTWGLFRRLFEPEEWYTPPRRYYWQADPVQTVPYGTPPCGQVDVVPIEAPLSVLKSYRVLVFLGWNTMTEEIYAKLRSYVEAGGRLLMSLAQTSAHARRGQSPDPIHGGDLRDLFGVRVDGPGETPEMIRFVRPSASRRYEFPENALYIESAQLARVQLGGATALAESVKGAPVLVENRCGKGYAYLLTTWGYPGLRLESFMTDVLRTISNGEQDEVTVQGELISYAVYPRRPRSSRDLTTVYVVNRSLYGLPQHCRVGVRGSPVPVRVDGHDMRIVWTAGDLLLSPFDRLVRVDQVRTGARRHVVRLVAEKGRHRIQIAGLERGVSGVLLDGKRKVVHRDADGALTIDYHMNGEHELAVELR